MSDGEQQTEAPRGQVSIADWLIPVIEPVTEPNLARFAPKVTTGDYTVDNEDLLSTWILNDFSGGGQIEKIDEGADQGRFYHATVDTTRPNQTTLAPLARIVTGPNTSNAYPLGVLGSTFYTSWGTAIRAVSGSPAAIGGSGTLSATPVGKGVAFKGTGTVRLFIPLGESGFDAWDGSDPSHAATPKVKSFGQWDNKLFALGTDGTFSRSSDGIGFELIATLDGAFVPKHLVGYFNRQNEETLHIVTDAATFAYDAETGKLVMTSLTQPPHPYNGLGVTVFDNRLHVSAGTGVTMYDGSIKGPMGPNREDGLPYLYRGPIRDLEAEHNGFYALVEGAPTIATASETFETEEGVLDDEPVFAGTTSTASLMKFTGRGWHTLWASSEATANATWMSVSAAGGTYRLFWGYGSTLYYHDLDPFFANPKQIALAGTGSFAPSGRLETGDFDAGMEGFWKLGSSVKTKLLKGSATETVTVSYSTDGGESWTTMGQVNTTEETRFFFGDDRQGLPFLRERLAFDYARDPNDVTKTPVFAYAVMSYRKIGRVSRAWDFRIPLTHPDGFNGKSNEEIIAHLYNLAGIESGEGQAQVPTYFDFVIGDETHRAQLTQVTRTRPTGSQASAGQYLKVMIVEIPE